MQWLWSKRKIFNWSKEKEPFYATVYKRNFLRSGKSVKINKATLGIELEVCYKVKKSFFLSKGVITMKNISKYISHMAPCIEVVGYRQRKKGITSFGDLCSDFGANVKFLIGAKKKYKRINIGNLKTNISNKKINQSFNGNTNTVYINPLNSLRFVLNKLKKDKKDFDFIINISEDGWFGDSVGPHQHFSHSIFRSIEEGKNLIRSANNGISAYINSKGQIISKIITTKKGFIEFKSFKKVKNSPLL